MLHGVQQPRFPAPSAAISGLTPSQGSTNPRAAIQAGLPRYDRAAYEKAQAEKAARAEPTNAPAPWLESKTAAPTAPASTASSGPVLELPKITVRSTINLVRSLPRIDTVKPVEVEKFNPLEPMSDRDARLIKKHLSKLDQVLNRFPRIFGISAVAQAREAESIEQNAAQMNELAAGIETQAALGRDPKEIKREPRGSGRFLLHGVQQPRFPAPSAAISGLTPSQGSCKIGQSEACPINI